MRLNAYLVFNTKILIYKLCVNILIRRINMQIGSKKMNSLIETVKYLTEHKEATTEEIATYLKKDYTTALRIVKTLSEAKYAKIRLQSTAAMGKDKRYYSLTLYGLVAYLNLDNSFTSIREIAKTHSDVLLVFKKWSKFVESNCEQTIILNMKKAIKQITFSWYVIGPFISNTVIVPEQQTKQAESLDAGILGFTYLTSPLNHVKETLGDQWGGQQRILKVVENDYELRMARENMMYFFEVGCTEKQKALSEWRSYFSNQKSGDKV